MSAQSKHSQTSAHLGSSSRLRVFSRVRNGALLNLVDDANRFIGLSAGQLYLLCAILTVYEVVARYFFEAPTKWAFEVVMVLCATGWMLSGGYVALKRGHIAITIIRDLASPSVCRALDVFAQIVGFVALFTLTHAALEPMLSAIDIVELSGSGFSSPMPTVLKTVLFIGAFLFWIQVAVNLMRDFQSTVARGVVALLAAACVAQLFTLTLQYYAGPNVLTQAVDGLFTPAYLLGDLLQSVDARAFGVGAATVGIVVALLALMLTGMPLAIATLSISVATSILFFGGEGLFLVSSNAYGLLEKYPLVAVPLFVFMASILERAGIARDLFDAMSALAGNLRGGVAVQTTVVAVVLAAMTGVLGGEIVMLGLVALPQMLRLGYNRKLAMGTICAGGALATLIPPSIIIIVYGLAAQVAIGDLFLAGVLPGLLLAGLYITYILVISNLKPSLAPVAAESLGTRPGRRFGMHQVTALGLAAVLITVVLGSIYAGIASVTEAAGVGVAGAMLVAIVRLRFNWTNVQDSLRQTMRTVGMIVWLVLGAVSLVGIYNVIGGNSYLHGVFAGLGVAPLWVILLMVAVLIVLGTFMEWIAIVFITVPIFAPVVVEMAPQMGMDPRWAALWFGVIFVMNVQISFLSPPFGPACFYLKSVAPSDVSLQEIFLSVLPFVALQILGILLVIAFPEIALYLPKLLND